MDLENIFNTYYDKIYSFTLLRVGNIQNAEDIASDVFVRVVEKIDTYRPEKAALSTWIFSIAINEIKMYYRGRKVTGSLDELYKLADRLNIEEELLRQDERVHLCQAISELNDRQKNAVLLKYFAGLSNRQVSEIMGLSETNVETILYRAKIILKNSLIKCEESCPVAYKEVRKEGSVR